MEKKEQKNYAVKCNTNLRNIQILQDDQKPLLFINKNNLQPTNQNIS